MDILYFSRLPKCYRKASCVRLNAQYRLNTTIYVINCGWDLKREYAGDASVECPGCSLTMLTLHRLWLPGRIPPVRRPSQPGGRDSVETFKAKGKNWHTGQNRFSPFLSNTMPPGYFTISPSQLRC